MYELTYSSFELALAVIFLFIFMGVMITWIYVSHIYKDKRYKELIHVAEKMLKRSLSLDEALTIRLTYERLSYGTVIGIITGIYENLPEDE